MTPEQRARLPKWALKEVERMERNVASLQAEIDERDGKFAEWKGLPRVFVDHYDKSPRPVATDRDSLRFYVGDLIRPNDWIDVSLRGGVVQILGERAISVCPQSGNAVTIGLGMR